MRNLIVLFFLMGAFSLYAQDDNTGGYSIPDLNVEDSSRDYGQGEVSALTVLIPDVGKNLVKKELKKHFKGYKAKIDTEKSGWFVNSAKNLNLSANPVSYFSFFEEEGNGVRVFLSAEVDSALIDSEAGDKYGTLKNELNQFSLFVTKRMHEQNLESAEKELSKLQKKLEKLKKENRNLHNSIKKNEKNIKQSEKEIKTTDVELEEASKRVTEYLEVEGYDEDEYKKLTKQQGKLEKRLEKLNKSIRKSEKTIKSAEKAIPDNEVDQKKTEEVIEMQKKEVAIQASRVALFE